MKVLGFTEASTVQPLQYVPPVGSTSVMNAPSSGAAASTLPRYCSAARPYLLRTCAPALAGVVAASLALPSVALLASAPPEVDSANARIATGSKPQEMRRP